MSRPRLLDAYCGAGGSSMGYHLAGFDVTGVDSKPMPRYPFTFVQGDAIQYITDHGHEFDALAASPPCQGYSAMRNLPWLKDRDYPMLIEPTRKALERTGKPWVIENVERAPLLNGITLCGTMFGLKTYRHRRFESNVLLLAPPHAKHTVVIGHGRMLNDRANPNADSWVSLPGKATEKRKNGLRDNPNGMVVVAGHFAGQDAARAAMGITWMSRDELAEAIPPAYCKFIGEQLMSAISQPTTPSDLTRTPNPTFVHERQRKGTTAQQFLDALRAHYPGSVFHMAADAVAELGPAPDLTVHRHARDGDAFVEVKR